LSPAIWAERQRRCEERSCYLRSFDATSYSTYSVQCQRLAKGGGYRLSLSSRSRHRCERILDVADLRWKYEGHRDEAAPRIAVIMAWYCMYYTSSTGHQHRISNTALKMTSRNPHRPRHTLYVLDLVSWSKAPSLAGAPALRSRFALPHALGLEQRGLRERVRSTFHTEATDCAEAPGTTDGCSGGKGADVNRNFHFRSY
jgi:hypothetical protein